MFFTKIGAIIAKLALFFGLFRLVMGVVLIFDEDPAMDLRRYFNASTTGEVIDEALVVILFAVILGIAVEISRSINAGFASDEDDE